jgi:peptidoglycan DL-endopeptidase RipA
VHVSRRAGRRLVAASAAIATVASLLIVAPRVAGAAPTPPPNPTNGQLSAARSQQDALAGRVGVLGGQIAQTRIELQQLMGRRELAEQKVAYALAKLQDAKDGAERARLRSIAAQAGVERAHEKFIRYLQASYMSGEVGGTAGSLLTAKDPSALLEQSALEQYEAQHQVDAIGQLQSAKVEKSNADAAARAAVQKQAKATADAEAAKVAADNAVAAQKVQQARLETALVNSQHELDAAQSQLATLQGQRKTYLAYKAEQARLARIRAERARQARLAAERAARERAARESHQGQGGSSGPISSGPSAPSGGNWTAAKGVRAANRALSQLGVPYAWAGGGVYGPSRGVCDASNGAPNDCFVSGYDCSGLVLYAWGQFWAHYAATQFTQAGRYHPGAGDLRPGDLIFWSFNGRISGIHHVALYIGGGQIVEAPYSGGFVQVASLYEYGSFFGATRPLT